MRLLALSLLLFCGLLLPSCRQDAERTSATPLPPERPNVILIVADDLGWADLGSYGNPYFETPHLDALAATGIRFTRAYAAASVCSPTRASILTGRYPARVGLTNYLYGTKTVADAPVDPAPFVDRLPLAEHTLPEALKTDGYVTALMGKWHLGENTSFGESDPGFHGFDVTRGFDYELLPVGASYEWFRIGDGSRAYRLPELTDEITANSVDFIRAHRDTSFFLMVSHFAVHLPLQGDSALVARFRAKPNPRPADYHPVYAAMLAQLDRSVGDILAAVDANGLAERTVVVFVSDNGGLAVGEAGDKPTVNDPLRAGKGTLYEGGIRVPLIARYPGHGRAGVADSSVVSTIDLLPTFLGLVRGGYRPDAQLDGVNWSALLTDLAPAPAPHDPERSLFWHYPHFSNQGGRPRAAIRSGNHKLLRSLEDGALELYDLAADPGEREDLTDRYPDRAAELAGRLADWQQDCGARFPVPKNR